MKEYLVMPNQFGIRWRDARVMDFLIDMKAGETTGEPQSHPISR